MDGLDARDHIVQLLKDSYTHKELNNKLNFTRGDTDANSNLFASKTSHHLRLSAPSTHRSQLDQIKAIRQFNLIGGSSSDGAKCSLSPFTIQTLHLLTTELLKMFGSSAGQTNMLDQFKYWLLTEKAQITKEELVELGLPEDELERMGAVDAQVNQEAFLEILKSLEAVVAASEDELGACMLRQAPDQQIEKIDFYQRVLLPALIL